MIPFWKKTGKDGKKKPQKPAVPRTAQQSIPMQRMFEDGTCRVKPNYYTRTIQYQDINYQLAQQEDKTAIFEEWCSFLNFFDSSIKFELSFVNMATDSTEFEKSIRIPFQKDGFDDVRAEYSQMLRQQLAKGNNGLTKTKFITFGVEGESMAQVKPRLDHIQNDLLNNFHRLGVQAKPLNGVQRLKLMHDMFNMDGASKFHFDWKDLVKSGLSVKDAIAPTAFAFKNSRTFQMGGIYCAASFLSITASDISDQLLKDFLDMDSSQIVTMHIQSVDQNKAIKTVKRTITELDRSKIEEQKKAIRAGYDIDIIPSDLATYGRDAKALLKELQSQNERMFLVTFLVLNTGRTEQELENNVFQASSIAQKHNCNLCRLDFQQEQGLMSSLPLADCQIEIQRWLTTSSTAIFIPFTTQELYQSGKESLYYGLNALSNNLIMVDRKKLKNPNGLILGTPGSGKSFSAKREITNAFLVTDDDIIICDPEAEYAPLVERLHGQVIHIGPASTQYINPMDINSNYSEEDNPLALKADFILSLCELVVGGKEGLQPVEKTVIDRCVHVVYRKYFENPTPENMPLLEDLYNALLTQDEPEARHVAAALEIYVKGSLNIFNHHTNVDIHNRIVCFDIKQLGKQLKKLGIQCYPEFSEKPIALITKKDCDSMIRFIEDSDARVYKRAVLKPEAKEFKTVSCPKIAKECTIREETIERIFRGETVSLDSAQQVAAALGKTVEQMFEVEIDRRPMTKKTMREYNLFIRSVLNYANDNYGTSLQMPMIKASGRKGKSVDCLHSDEVEALQAALQECSMLEKAIVLCLLNTGVRRGELAGLTWKDVNFREGTIHVSKSLLVFPNYGYQLTTTKESNIRDVDVAPEFMDFLKDYYAQWKAQKKLMGASWQKNLEKKGSKYAQSLLDLRGNDFVICNDYGFPINPDSYGALVRRVGKKAGIEKIHPHMFRHTFVSILLSNPNIGVATVAAEAGHAQPSTTLAIYTQVYDRRRDEIRKQMSRELYK